MFESCLEIRPHFYDFLEGVCDRVTFRSVQFHLTYCASCREEIERRQALVGEVRTLPRRRIPPELALRLRVLVSRRLHEKWLGRFLIYIDNALKPLVVPASAGLLTAIICFGLIMGSPGVPLTNAPEAPPQASTPPRVRALAPVNFSTGEDGVLLVTHIDSDGRVLEYAVLSGPHSPKVIEGLDRMMFFSHFEPATLYGKPTDGQMVLRLRRITVRG